MKIASVVGARPNFIKLAPIHKAISNFSDLHHTIIHTGQHYDYKLSQIFFKEFTLPKPNYNLEVGSGTPGFQIGEMVKRLENIFLESSFDLVVVYGDTNSTFAGALSAARSGIRVAHIESGLRSFDRHMPEEINRVLTDHVSDYLFAPTPTAIKNLERENSFGKVFYTGDLSVEIVKDAVQFSSKSIILNKLQLASKSYILFTMHRAENTDSQNSLISVIRSFEILSEIKIVFPIHPRTKHILKRKNLWPRLEKCKNVKLIQPVGYVDFIKLVQNAKKIVTDSGGIQKESYLLDVPCITIRNNTEWVETVNEGWNILTGNDTNKIVKAIRDWMPATDIQKKPILGDGLTSSVIIKNLIMLFGIAL
jgi:UDP-N-acetylglucosamine 2-epimerase